MRSNGSATLSTSSKPVSVASDEFWDFEAITDERYAKGSWGMDDDDDAETTIGLIITLITAHQPDGCFLVGDYGCGPGRLLRPMAQYHSHSVVYGFDVSANMLTIAEAAIATLPQHNAHVSLLPIRDSDLGVFDLVYCVEVFQHLRLEQVDAAVSDIYAMLRPGGVFVGQFVTAGERALRSWPYPVAMAREIIYRKDRDWIDVVDFTAVHEAWHWFVLKKA